MGIEDILIAAKAESSLGNIPSELVDQAFNEAAHATARVLLMSTCMSLDEPITNKEKRQSVKKNIARTYFDALANLLGYAEGKKDLHDYSHQQRIELAQGLKEFYLGVIRESVHVTESVEKRLEKISGRVAEFSKQLGKNKIVFNGLEDAASYLKREYASFDKGQGVAAKGRPD